MRGFQIWSHNLNRTTFDPIFGQKMVENWILSVLKVCLTVWLFHFFRFGLRQQTVPRGNDDKINKCRINKCSFESQMCGESPCFGFISLSLKALELGEKRYYLSALPSGYVFSAANLCGSMAGKLLYKDVSLVHMRSMQVLLTLWSIIYWCFWFPWCLNDGMHDLWPFYTCASSPQSKTLDYQNSQHQR